jgi:uncharacterized MAPEG superfamily protein
MFRSKSEKPRERFYLLPGQGGRSYRRKQKYILTWAIIVALFLSAILTGLLYLMNR